MIQAQNQFSKLLKNYIFKKNILKIKFLAFMLQKLNVFQKEKIHKKYEFGNKVSITATSYGDWIVGAKAFHGNPYDGNTLNKILQQVHKNIQTPKNIFVNMGYKGNNYFGKAKVHISKWNKCQISSFLWKLMKRG